MIELIPGQRSAFLFGFTVTEDNLWFDFNEGGAEISAEVSTDSYTAEEIASAVETALNAEGSLTYTVTFDRVTRKFTIAADGNFTILGATGTHSGASVLSTLGFGATDLTGDDSYLGASAAGSLYTPPFTLQDFIDPANWLEKVDASINESSSGDLETVTFGDRRFCQLNITMVSDIIHGSRVIDESENNVTNLNAFMEHSVNKRKVQFMPDADDLEVYEAMILESTPHKSDGTGYKLREMYDQGMPGWFETGALKWRIVTEDEE